ncbi:glycosyl hydrolase [Acidihalobacter ferrooxydans]|uniref:Glycosyl hydrolase n=2 Tax=Acidihalobacter ferrooxydans TaxID=1765967 RepID=A0A1P8ULH9_9GAMM|nr:glycosyl hydrolase [Acidihalobacter ferrooxydans]
MHPPCGKAPVAETRKAVWSSARKEMVGTALGASRVWFTLARGIVSEVYYPRIDIPQLRELDFVVADGVDFWVALKGQDAYSVERLEDDLPLAMLVHRHPRFELRLRVCVDPHRDVLLLEVTLDGDETLRPYALLAARLGGDAEGNLAATGEWDGRRTLWADQGPFALALQCCDVEGRPALDARSVGEVGASDLREDFARHGAMRWHYAEAGPGEVALGARLPRRCTLAVGFAGSREAADTLAWSTLALGFESVWDAYADGWRHWREVCACPRLPRLDAAVAGLFRRSLNVLKIHEDRTYPGALVASLAVPWGEANESRGGYHLVWSRDLVESAGALVALGAYDTARDVLAYLHATQQADGHWLQNQWLGGKPFWQGIQLDETAFPVLLAGLLAAHGELGAIPVTGMVELALRFILAEGPCTGQDRWEEDPGINTFTLAIAIGALVEGAQFLHGRAAELALMVADYWNANIESWCWAQDTALAREAGVSGYYLRAAPVHVLMCEGAKAEHLFIKNRAHDYDRPADEQISTDFLQLVRYGLRDAHDPCVVSSLKVVDRLLRHDTPHGPVWHRYNGDGYGEHPDGTPFDGTGRGRGWPLLIGERGHYALLAGEDVGPYLRSMAAMTGRGGLLPEQVWDAAPIPEHDLEPGAPTGAAMPLVWAHSEFVKLCLSLEQGRPVDAPPRTWARYGGQRPTLDYVLWRFRQRPRTLRQGQELRVLLRAPATVHWGVDGWQDVRDTPTEDWALGHLACLPTGRLAVGSRIDFTFRWSADGQWQGEDFAVEVIAQ